MGTLIIIGIVILVFVIIYQYAKRQTKQSENIGLKENVFDKDQEKIIKIRELLFEYGKEKGKLGEILYDIEEGGHYVREYRREDKIRLNKLISNLIDKYRSEIIADINTDFIISKIKSEIDGLKDGVNGSIGF